jgi:hypothetical protein
MPLSLQQPAEPDPARAAIWEGLWASYERAHQAITQHCHADPVAQERLIQPVPPAAR